MRVLSSSMKKEYKIMMKMLKVFRVSQTFLSWQPQVCRILNMELVRDDQ